MPIYEYQCRDCGRRFEVRQSASDDPVAECIDCEGPVRKIFHPVGIIYKTGGFHITDYTRKNGSETPPSQTEAGGQDKQAAEKPADPAPSASPSQETTTASS